MGDRVGDIAEDSELDGREPAEKKISQCTFTCNVLKLH